MTNEEKAIRIVEQYETRYNDTRDLLWTDLEDIAMQAMQWKEQQMIDKAWQWIFIVFAITAPLDFQQAIEKEFRKEMKGE